jgi:hypothetical protein
MMNQQIIDNVGAVRGEIIYHINGPDINKDVSMTNH